jgi:hypothetical protein
MFPEKKIMQVILIEMFDIKKAAVGELNVISTTSEFVKVKYIT